MNEDRKPENRVGTAPNRPTPPVDTRWKRGQSGNPGGRPRGSGRLSKALAHKMLEPFPDDPGGRTFVEVIADKLAAAAAAGDIPAIREVADRTEGKAAQTVVNVELRDRFDRMSADELLRYAESGDLPDWFHGSEGVPDEAN